MLDGPPQKTNISGQQKSVLRRVFGRTLDGVDEVIVHPFIGIEMKLPCMLNGQRGDCPVPLRAVALECMLNEFRAAGDCNRGSVVSAERIHDMHVVRHNHGALKRRSQRPLRVERQDDD